MAGFMEEKRVNGKSITNASQTWGYIGMYSL